MTRVPERLAPGAIGLEVEHRRLAPREEHPWGLLAAHRWLAIGRGGGRLDLAASGTRLHAGDVMLVPAGTRHRFRAGPKGLDLVQLRLRSRALAPNQNVDRLAAEVVGAAVAHARRHGGRLRLDAPALQALRSRLTGMADLAECGRHGHQLLLKAELLCLLHALAGAPPIRRKLARGVATTFSGAGGIRTVLAHIDEHFDEALSAAQAAALAGLGRTRFHRAFREATGLSFTAYLNRYRVGRAAELLRRTERPILDVAFGCGFGSVSRFYEVFKRELGVPPRRYRQDAAGRPASKPGRVDSSGAPR